MSIASWLGSKLVGEVIADLGSVRVSRKSDTWRLALSLRAKAGEPKLVFHWQTGGQKSWMAMDAEPQELERLESMIREARDRAKGLGAA